MPGRRVGAGARAAGQSGCRARPGAEPAPAKPRRKSVPHPRLVLATTLILGLLPAACAEAEPSSPPNTGPHEAQPPVEERTQDEAFELVLRLPRLSWTEGEPIEAEATLTYRGPQPVIRVFGSGSGLVLFALAQVGGVIQIGPAATADCVPRVLERGVPLVVPYKKSGGFSATDPNAAWYRAFFADPLLRLPEGRWELSALAEGYTGAGCGDVSHRLSVSVELDVRR